MKISIAGPTEVINYYLLSLASADLLCGLLVVPLSVYPALVRRWVYGDIVCRLVGYLEVTLWAVSVYTFMWISVDRYLAIRFEASCHRLSLPSPARPFAGGDLAAAAPLTRFRLSTRRTSRTRRAAD